MKHITDIEAGGDKTAAYLYRDEDRGLDKFIIVNNKKASAAIKVECLDKVLKEIELGSYETLDCLLKIG